jgi:hypothetical protein
MILVSGYINIESIEHTNRVQTFPIYKERGQKLINLPIKKIIFIDADYINQFITNRYTELIPIKFEDMEIYQYYIRICSGIHSGEITILSPNLEKDTALFHIIQIAKTEFIKKAIELNTNNIQISDDSQISNETDNLYGWIDFGISKIFQNDNEFTNTICNIPNLLDKIKSNTIKIPGCWPLNPYDSSSDFMRVQWYFCGGFFIGYKDKLLEFEKQVKEELRCILEEEKKLIFEVNIWFRIWKKGFQGLEWYYGDHNASMFNL